MKKILSPVVLILQLCMPVQKLILHTFFNARVPLGLCQINISIWAWHQDSILYPIGGGEYLTLWAWRVKCEQSLFFLLSHGDWEHMWGATGKAALITPPFSLATWQWGKKDDCSGSTQRMTNINFHAQQNRCNYYRGKSSWELAKWSAKRI